MWLAFAFTVAGVPLLLYLLGRRAERRVRQDWERLLHPEWDETGRDIERQVVAAMAGAERLLDDAVALRSLGSAEEAQRRLEAGHAELEHLSGHLLKLLAATAEMSRCARPTAPVLPLSRHRFQLEALARHARCHGRLHRFVPAPLRGRLRAYFLGRGVRLLVASLRRAPAERSAHDPRVDLRRLVEGLFGEPSDRLLWQWAERREQWRDGPRPASTSVWAVVLLVLLAACEWLRQTYGA